jgi:hypothetical protein
MADVTITDQSELATLLCIGLYHENKLNWLDN